MNNHNHKTILNFASLKISSFHYFYCFIHSYFDVKPLLYLFVPKIRVKIYLFVILIRKLTNEIYLLVGLVRKEFASFLCVMSHLLSELPKRTIQFLNKSHKKQETKEIKGKKKRLLKTMQN